MSTDHYAEAVSSIDSGNETSLADPACAYYIQRAQVHATLAVADAIRAQLAAYVEDRDQARGWLADAAEHAADKCPKCFYPIDVTDEGEKSCDNCGWSA